MSDIIEKAKAHLQNMFDGDNQHDNIVDHIEDAMVDKKIVDKMDEIKKRLDEEIQ